MPASTSPDSTAASVDLTSARLATGFTVVFALAKTVVATTPQGTVGSQTATLTPGFARSWTVAMSAGSLGLTAISPVFAAKSFGSTAAAPSASMFLTDADANTSTGAPCWIWVDRAGRGAGVRRVGPAARRPVPPLRGVPLQRREPPGQRRGGVDGDRPAEAARLVR